MAGSSGVGTATGSAPLHFFSVGWAPLPTLAVGWACFAQVLSFRGVAIWVAGGSLLVLLVMRLILGAGRVVLGLLSGVALTLVFAFLADTYGGTTSGPLARATLLACGLTAASVAFSFTRYRLLLLVPTFALLGSALGLGAAGRSGVWVGLWVVAAAVTAAMLGPYRERDLAARGRRLPFALLIACSGLVAIVSLVIASPMLVAPWTIPGGGGGATPSAVALPPVALLPPEVLAAPPPIVTAPPVSQPPIVSPAPPPPEASASIISTIIQWVLLILLALLLLLLLLLAWLLVRRLSSWIRWRALRWRLSRGTPEQRVVGAWTWIRLRLAMRGDPLPDSASPDVAVEWALARGDSSLATVARLTARVAFNPQGTISMPDSALAWEHALTADRRSRRE